MTNKATQIFKKLKIGENMPNYSLATGRLPSLHQIHWSVINRTIMQECQLITGKLSNNTTGYGLWKQTKCCNPTRRSNSRHNNLLKSRWGHRYSNICFSSIHMYTWVIYIIDNGLQSRDTSVIIKLKLYEL